MLEKMKAAIGEINMIHQQKERIKMIDKIDSMLFQNENQATTIKPARFLGDDPFADYVNPAIENMPDNDRFCIIKVFFGGPGTGCFLCKRD